MSKFIPVLIAAFLATSLGNVILFLLPLPSTGVTQFSIPLGPSVPLVSVPMQALIGLGFSNMEMIHVVR